MLILKCLVVWHLFMISWRKFDTRAGKGVNSTSYYDVVPEINKFVETIVAKIIEGTCLYASIVLLDF